MSTIPCGAPPGDCDPVKCIKAGKQAVEQAEIHR
jgi:hypothetical protein